MTAPTHPTLAEMLIGKTKKDAEDMLGRAVARWRVRSEDGKPLRVSMEHLAHRYNLYLEDGKVTKVTMG